MSDAALERVVVREADGEDAGRLALVWRRRGVVALNSLVVGVPCTLTTHTSAAEHLRC